MRTVSFAAQGVEVRARVIDDSGFFPFAGEDVDVFVGERMNVRGNSRACVKLSKDGQAASRFVLVQNEQLDASVRAGLPLFVLRQNRVLEHASIKARRGKFASLLARQ